MNEKIPLTAAILAIVGSVFVLIGGLVEAALGAFISLFLPGYGSAIIGGAFGVGAGCLIMSILLFVAPAQKLIWGILLIVFAILSLVFDLFGGFIIGFILVLIGGIMAITYKPASPQVVYVQAMGTPPMAAPPPNFPPPPPPMG